MVYRDRTYSITSFSELLVVKAYITPMLPQKGALETCAQRPATGTTARSSCPPFALNRIRGLKEQMSSTIDGAI
jgi:hypothetical protein